MYGLYVMHARPQRHPCLCSSKGTHKPIAWKHGVKQRQARNRVTIMIVSLLPMFQQLCQCLQPVVFCAALVERVGGFEAELEWSHVLSLGEQQRVAMLRLLLHKPALAFLDEATGALDNAIEAALYTALRRSCSSYVSVGEFACLLWGLNRPQNGVPNVLTQRACRCMSAASPSVAPCQAAPTGVSKAA